MIPNVWNPECLELCALRMNKHVSILYLVLALCVPFWSALAQTREFECRTGSALSSEQAKSVLGKVQDRYQGIESMRGVFRQDSYVAALDEGEKSSGEMVFAKPGRMRWSYKAPRQQEVVIRDQELWMYQPDKSQVFIDDIGNVLLSALPISFLMGLGNVTRDFDMDSACRSSSGTILKLRPRKSEGDTDSRDGLAGFDLLVDESKNLPIGAKIESLGGNVTAIIFENLELTPTGVSASTFVLEYPKGVDIMDRRVKAGS